MKKNLILALAVLGLTGMAQAVIVIPDRDLANDPEFTTNPGGALPTTGLETWRWTAKTPPEASFAQIQTSTNTSVAGLSSQFSVPVDLLSHSSVTNLPYYDINKTSLESITPNFTIPDLDYAGVLGLLQTHEPAASQVYNSWYVLTLDTAGGTFTGTSGIGNIFTPTATNSTQLSEILAAAWNTLTWDSDPFAGGAIAYTNINAISLEFFYTNEVANTTDNAAWFNFDRASIDYSISIDATDIVSPDAPTSLTATGAPQRINLAWSANTEADLASYNVKRSETAGSGYTVITNVASTSFADTNVVNGTTYYYVVSAVDFAGNESDSSAEASASPVDNLPSIPTGLSALAGNMEVQLDWNDNSEPEGDLDTYGIYRSTTSGSGYARVGNSPTSNFTDTNAVNGLTYYYVVTAIDLGANESGYSSEVSAKPQAKTLVPVTYLLDDPFFDAKPSTAIPTSGSEKWRYNGGKKFVQIQTDPDTAVAGDSSSFTAPITLTNHAAVITNADYNVATTTLDAISPNFNTGDIAYVAILKLIGSAKVDSWYVVTIDSVGGTYSATSGVANLFASNVPADNEAQIVAAWNTLTWDTDPFASGGIVYEDINSIGIEWFHYTDQPVTNTTGSAAMWFNFTRATIGYTATLYPESGSPYDLWSATYGLAGGANGDDDNDGLSNLGEYGQGGDPTNSADRGILPVFGTVDNGGGSVFEYVYSRRTDDGSLGYHLETTPDLAYTAWTNSGYSVVGIGPDVDGFDTVTNQTSLAEDAKFIRVIIEQN